MSETISGLQFERQEARNLPTSLFIVQNDLEGCRSLIRTGDSCVRKAEFQHALSCYARAIDGLKNISDPAVDRLFLSTVISCINIIPTGYDRKWVTATLMEALARADALSDRPYQALYNMHMAVNLWQQSLFQLSQEHYERGRELAREVDHPRFLKAIATISAFYLTWQGRFPETIKIYETSIQDVEQFPNGRFPLYATINIAYSYAATGQVNQALGMLDAVRAHALKMKRYNIVGQAVLYIGHILNSIGRGDDVYMQLSDLDEQIEQYLEPWLRSELALLRAYLGFQKREITKSLEYLKKHLAIAATEIDTRETSVYTMHICLAIKQGEYPAVEGLSLETEIAQALKGGNMYIKGYGYMFQALSERSQEQKEDRLEELFKRALTCFDEAGNLMGSTMTKILMVRFYLGAGQEHKARNLAEQVAEVYAGYPELELPEDLKPLVKEIAPGGGLLEEILQIGLDMVTIRNDRRLVRHIVATVNRITGAERGAIFLIKPMASPPKFTLRSARNLTAEDTEQPDFKAAWEVIREVTQSGKGVIRKMHVTEDIPVGTSYNIRSCICVPMIIKNRIVGVLYHDNRFLSSAFRESDLKMFTYFAALAAVAMDNAAAYDEVQRLNRKLDKEKQFYKDLHLENIQFDDFIGESPPIRKLVDKVLKVADADTTVLISGETGVGKELVAGLVRDHSSRKNRPFIKVNCSAFSDGLIASELFGHEKGAFTGASDRRAGRFELADGGTIFLDEIGDIPMEVQIRLLRVLQNQEFERVGGTRTLKPDFRLIAATNQDLQKLVTAGRFRKDLYFRLNVFPVHVPPLRERQGDIPLLAHYFLKIYAGKTGRSFTKILKSEMDKLLKYDWPGNVRELENVVERGTIMSTDDRFRVPELAINLNPGQKKKFGKTLKEAERSHINWALEQTRWKIRGPGGAAELLDIHYSTLRSRMKKLGIRR